MNIQIQSTPNTNSVAEVYNLLRSILNKSQDAGNILVKRIVCSYDIIEEESEKDSKYYTDDECAKGLFNIYLSEIREALDSLRLKMESVLYYRTKSEEYQYSICMSLYIQSFLIVQNIYTHAFDIVKSQLSFRTYEYEVLYGNIKKLIQEIIDELEQYQNILHS